MNRLCLYFIFGLMTVCAISCTAQVSAPADKTALPASGEVPRQWGHSANPPNTGVPALHAIHSEELKRVMAEINALVYGKLHAEIDLAQEKRLRAKEIGEIAHELSTTVAALRDTLPSLGLLPGEQDTFLALANKLQTEAKQIEVDAGNDDIRNIPDRMRQIETTCNACHSLFRKPRSLLDRCRDPKHTC